MINSQFAGKTIFDFATKEQLKDILPDSITKEIYLQETSECQMAYDLADYFDSIGEKEKSDEANAYGESLPQIV